MGAADPVVGAVHPVAGAFDPILGRGGPMVSVIDPVTGAVEPVGGVIDPVTAGGGTSPGFPFDVLTGLTPGSDEAFLVSALVSIAGTALAIRATSPTVASVLTARFVLAGVSPIPLRCFVGETMTRFVSTAAEATRLRGGGGIGPATGRAAAAVGDTAAGVADKAGAAADKATAAAEELAHTIRDGFLRGAGRAEVDDDEARDTRLMIQLGMLLGTVYLAFLTVWFWATRLRWNPRS